MRVSDTRFLLRCVRYLILFCNFWIFIGIFFVFFWERGILFRECKQKLSIQTKFRSNKIYITKKWDLNSLRQCNIHFYHSKVMVSKNNKKTIYIKVSKNRTKEELKWRTAMSISKDHKTELNFYFILELSFSYWPINQLTEKSSPIHGNLNITSTELQLMKSIVSRPYMTLMKCWGKQKITFVIRN